jgi:cytochrome b
MTISDTTATGGPTRLKVWDPPTRIFHWTLVAIVAAALVSGNIGGNAMLWHMRCGYATLTLLIFRIVWGLAGSRSARFSAFLRGPRAVWAYARTLPGRNAQDHPGHNPLGGWSVAAMLAALLIQAVTGLFSDDGIITQGPLAHLVSADASGRLTALHLLNRYLVAALILLHVAAIVFYAAVKHTNLIVPMLTGVKMWHGAPPPEPLTGRSWPALIVTAVAIGIVYWLVRGPHAG